MKEKLGYSVENTLIQGMGWIISQISNTQLIIQTKRSGKKVPKQVVELGCCIHSSFGGHYLSQIEQLGQFSNPHEVTLLLAVTAVTLRLLRLLVTFFAF